MATNNDGMTPEERDLQRQRAEALQSTLDNAARAAKATADRKALFGRAQKVADDVQQAANTVGRAIDEGAEALDAAAKKGEKIVRAAAPVAKGAGRFTMWGLPKALRAIGRLLRWMYYPLRKDGKRHFQPFKGTLNGVLSAAAVFIGVGEAVNLTSIRSYDYVYVNQAVPHHQQDVVASPGVLGLFSSAADETYTVAGEYREPNHEYNFLGFQFGPVKYLHDTAGNILRSADGKPRIEYGPPEAVRLNIRENLWTGTMPWDVPNIGAVIPNGNAICSFEVNGYMTRLPQGIRVGLLKYFNQTPNIMKVKGGQCINMLNQISDPDRLGPWSHYRPSLETSPQAANDSYHVPSAYAVRTNVGPVRFDRTPAAPAARLG